MIYGLSRRNAVHHLEDSVRARALALAHLVENDRDRLDSDIPDRALPEFAVGGDQLYQLWDADGREVERSPSLGAHHLAHRAPLAWITLPDGRPGVQATLTFVAAPDGAHPGAQPLSATIAFARDTRELDVTLAELRTVLLVAGGIATLACLALLAWIARVGLRPLRTLADQIAAVSPDDPDARFDAAALPSELRPVSARLDELLARLHASLARERALTADVAHELRTPLAGLKATLQLALSRDREPERYRAAMLTCLRICEQTAQLVESLLALAQQDAPVTSAPGSLHAVITDALAASAPRYAHVDTNLVDAQVASPERVRLLVDNLLDNAVAHGDGQRLSITTQLAETTVTLRIANSGTAVAADDAARVFERFWRADPARSIGEHAGLGLALCQRIVDVLGGSITARSTPPDEFVITVQLPIYK